MSLTSPLCLLAILLAVPTFADEPTAPPRTHDLVGTVLDLTPDPPPRVWQDLATVNPEDEQAALAALAAVWQRPAPNVTVTLIGTLIRRNAVADDEGGFTFASVPPGNYELRAQMPRTLYRDGSPWIAEGTRSVTVPIDRPVRLELCPLALRTVSVTGRVTDAHGNPVAGATVTGEPEPIPEGSEPHLESVTTRTDADGNYTLTGLRPVHVWRVAGYLNGGDLAADNGFGHYVRVVVTAPGFTQLKADRPRVPLVTEYNLDTAHRLRRAMLDLAARLGERVDPANPEQPDPPPPACRGNTILGVDVTLQRHTSMPPE